MREPMINRSKLLFVDDQENVRDAMRRSLRQYNESWELHFAADVSAALQILGQFEFDAVVSDLKMPGRDGFDLLNEIRSNDRTADLPVVILTGCSELDLKRRALDAGASDLLNKPVTKEDLIARIKNVLRIKEYQDQIKRHARELEQAVQDRTMALERSQQDIVWRLGKAAEYRDEETGGHVVRVGQTSRIIAEVLGLPPEYCKSIYLASPLHDIGKIAIPDYILKKPGRLTYNERIIMQQHCVIGQRILEADSTPFLSLLDDRLEANVINLWKNNLLTTAGLIALSHHEWWDGSGYPNRLSGEDIPLEARIVAVADVYDALSSVRPYKAAVPHAAALDIMKHEVGSHFDPQVWYAFLKVSDLVCDVATNLTSSFTLEAAA